MQLPRSTTPPSTTGIRPEPPPSSVSRPMRPSSPAPVTTPDVQIRHPANSFARTGSEIAATPATRFSQVFQHPSGGGMTGTPSIPQMSSSLRPPLSTAPRQPSPPRARPSTPLSLTRPPSDFTRPSVALSPARPLYPTSLTRPYMAPASFARPYAAPLYSPAYYGYYSPSRPYARISPWVSLSPFWWGPVLYPAGFGFTWTSRNFGISFSTYSPYYAYRPYYDSWNYNGWGYSSAYYGGWSRGWYGGFSYVYNPWPVYRTYYLYSPPEVVYVDSPSRTIIQQTIVQPPAQPLTLAPPDQPPAQAQHAFEADEGYHCFCACHCDGLVPCTCEYPCGSEFEDTTGAFRLGDYFVSYTVSLNPETIWASYAGFDRIL